MPRSGPGTLDTSAMPRISIRLPNRCLTGVTQPAICSEPFLSAMVSNVRLVAGKESFCGVSN